MGGLLFGVVSPASLFGSGALDIDGLLVTDGVDGAAFFAAGCLGVKKLEIDCCFLADDWEGGGLLLPKAIIVRLPG